jgi:membrane protein YqaA with SNARE-associated domain
MPNTHHPAAPDSVTATETQRLRLRDAWRHPRRWADQLGESRAGLWLIGVASFLETIIVPIPIEVVMIPYMLARRDLLWRIAAVTTLACLLAATLGYGLGYFFYDSLGRAMIDFMGWQEDYTFFQEWFNAQGFWAILAIGVAPIPFQIAMLVAGVAAYPLLLFILAATIARGIRYFGLAYLVHRFGDQALGLWERHRVTASIALLVLIGALVAFNI